MKKTIITMLIIIVICAIACVSVIALTQKWGSKKTNVEYNTGIASANNTQSLAEAKDESTTTQEDDITHSTVSQTDPNAHLGSSIVQNSSKDATEAETPMDATTEFPKSYDLELKILSQYPELPSGCESVSLTMMLNYYGYKLEKTDIAKDYLVYSGNFVLGYCGDPFSSSVGGGIYAPGMTTTANNFFSANGNRHYAKNITGTDLDLLLEYVADGHPVLVWTTIEMMPCSKGHYMNDAEGNSYAWDYNEHCVVLTGYDMKANSLTIYDPISGIVYREKDAFEKTYNNMDKMSIVIKEY